MQLITQGSVAFHRPSKLAGVIAVGIGLAFPQAGVNADTQTIRVEVTFAERIEVAQASPQESASPTVSDRRSASAAAPSADSASATLVTTLSIIATPRRALILQVEPTAAAASPRAGFLCTYGTSSRLPCGGAGLPAISAADAELSISPAPATAESAESAEVAPTAPGFDITIIYQ